MEREQKMQQARERFEGIGKVLLGQQTVELGTFLIAEIDRLNTEREKLVETLRWYGEKPCIQDADVGWNIGYIARKRLKEIGIDVGD